MLLLTLRAHIFMTIFLLIRNFTLDPDYGSQLNITNIMNSGVYLHIYIIMDLCTVMAN